MPYGVIRTNRDGSVKYLSSSKGRPSWSSDIDDIARFVQEPSAMKVAKGLYLDNYGAEYDCTFQVVELKTTISETIKVPEPPKRTGFVIMLGTRYYNAGRSPKGYGGYDLIYRWTDSTHRATVFKSASEAEVVHDLIIDTADTSAKSHKDSYPRDFEKYKSIQIKAI